MGTDTNVFLHWCLHGKVQYVYLVNKVALIEHTQFVRFSPKHVLKMYGNLRFLISRNPWQPPPLYIKLSFEPFTQKLAKWFNTIIMFFSFLQSLLSLREWDERTQLSFQPRKILANILKMLERHVKSFQLCVCWRSGSWISKLGHCLQP